MERILLFVLHFLSSIGNLDQFLYVKNNFDLWSMKDGRLLKYLGGAPGYKKPAIQLQFFNNKCRMNAPTV